MVLFLKFNLQRFKLLALALLVSFNVVAENNIKHYVQLNSIFSDGKYAPFWLTANRQGLSSVDNSNGFARYGLTIDGALGKSKNWRYSMTADLMVGYNRENEVDLHQLNADISWKWLTLSVGAKQHYAEMRDFCKLGSDDVKDNANPLKYEYLSTMSELGSGGLVYSGNAKPVPQVRIGVSDYVNVPGTKSWLKVRGHIAYGLFLDNDFQEDFTKTNLSARYAKNVMYHSKALFLKFGNEKKFPLTVEGGLEMYSQFGGDIYTHAHGKILSMPRGFRDYIKAFIPLSGDETTPDTEQANISGNQIGNWHLAFTLHTAPVDIRLYGEHMFEDFSQLFFFEYQANKDGKCELVYYPWHDIQLGVSLKNKSGYLRFISNIQYEYTSTYNQSGACYNDPSAYFSEQMDGVDNYYNHSIYPGWHYVGMGIGNPLVVSPIYNTNGSLEFRGNRIKAHNVGMNGTIDADSEFVYRLMYTYSENWGTYVNPFKDKKYTTSLLADIMYLPKNSNWLFSLSVAYDKSNYIGDNWGVMLSLARLGLF